MSTLALASTSLVLRLYVAGNAPNSVRSIVNIKAICAEHFSSSELEIVDLLEEPDRGMADGIVVTPTLLRVLPVPVLRLVGDLSDTSQVLQSLVIP